MKKITLIYASHDGHTQTVSKAIQAHLQTAGVDCSVVWVKECEVQCLVDSDIVVCGAPIRYGKHLPEMVDFIQQNRKLLDNKITAFFSVNLTARKAHRSTPETNNYLKKFFMQLGWQPNVTEVFAGKLNYPQYRFFDKLMIRFIMWVTKGPTVPTTVHTFTDWQRVELFATRLQNIAQG